MSKFAFVPEVRRVRSVAEWLHCTATVLGPNLACRPTNVPLRLRLTTTHNVSKKFGFSFPLSRRSAADDNALRLYTMDGTNLVRVPLIVICSRGFPGNTAAADCKGGYPPGPDGRSRLPPSGTIQSHRIVPQGDCAPVDPGRSHLRTDGRCRLLV